MIIGVHARKTELELCVIHVNKGQGRESSRVEFRTGILKYFWIPDPCVNFSKVKKHFL